MMFLPLIIVNCKHFHEIFIFYLSIFQISGLGILIAGIVVLNDVMDFNHFLDGRLAAPPVILIVTGLLIFVIAFLGCYGALKESPKLLMAVSSLFQLQQSSTKDFEKSQNISKKPKKIAKSPVMVKISSIGVSVALHLALAFLQTYNQFTLSSLLVVTFLALTCSKTRIASNPDAWMDWFIDTYAVFMTMEVFGTILWGLFESAAKLLLRSFVTKNMLQQELLMACILISLTYHELRFLTIRRQSQ